MTDSLAVATSVLVLAPPCLLLAMAIRHGIPLMRGFQAPLWAYALGPFAFASDRFFTEQARPHRKRFLGYIGAFVACCVFLVAVVEVLK